MINLLYKKNSNDSEKYIKTVNENERNLALK